MDTDPAQDGVNVIGKLVYQIDFCLVYRNFITAQISISEYLSVFKDLQKKFDVQRAKLKELFLQKEGN